VILSNDKESESLFQRSGQTLIYQVPTLGPEEHGALWRIERVQRDLRYYLAEQKRWVGSMRRILSALAIQGSNGIEGYNVSVEDVIAAIEGDSPTEASEEDWEAVSGYRRAMTYVLQLARDDHFEFSPSLIRSLHYMMTEYSLGAGPGLWRPGAIWIQNNKTKKVVYEGPDPEMVPGLVEELVKQFVESPDVPVDVLAAMTHLNLAMIHPFRDGNGRMARCLQTLALARAGILVPEFCSIEEFLGANTDDYYAVLGEVGQGAWNPHHDARPWIRFCLTAHFVQATSVLRRVQESEQVWTALETIVTDRRVPVRSVAALFDATLGLRIRNASYRSILEGWEADISNQVATNDLRAIVNAGLLEQMGNKRGTYYVAAEPLRELRRQHLHGRQEIDTSDLFTPPPDPNGPSEPTLPFGQ
jgi:Fic family protein